MHLKGPCHCGAVKFRLQSDSPVPFMHCYCTICADRGQGNLKQGLCYLFYKVDVCHLVSFSV